MFKYIGSFLKPNKEKLAMFAILAFVAMVVFLSSDFVAFLDNPVRGQYPLADWSNEKLGFAATMYLGMIMFVFSVILFIPAVVLFIPIPYVATVAFVVLEAAYLYVIACLASSLLGFIKGKKIKK